MAGEMYSTGTVTVFGAGGSIAITGASTSDTINVAFADEVEIVEQRNYRGNVTGMVAHNQRDTVNISFYAKPTAVDEAGYKAIDIPAALSKVTVTRTAIPTGSYPLAAPSRIFGASTRDFTYIGGGRMELQQNGLMVVTLPCVKFVEMTP